jgi:hypothetical protein
VKELFNVKEQKRVWRGMTIRRINIGDGETVREREKRREVDKGTKGMKESNYFACNL